MFLLYILHLFVWENCNFPLQTFFNNFSHFPFIVVVFSSLKTFIHKNTKVFLFKNFFTSNFFHTWTSKTFSRFFNLFFFSLLQLVFFSLHQRHFTWKMHDSNIKETHFVIMSSFLMKVLMLQLFLCFFLDVASCALCDCQRNEMENECELKCGMKAVICTWLLHYVLNGVVWVRCW